MLKVNTTLTDINLGGNQLRVEGAKIIANLLETNTTLTSVSLQFNGLDIRVEEQLHKAAGSHVKLEL